MRDDIVTSDDYNVVSYWLGQYPEWSLCMIYWNYGRRIKYADSINSQTGFNYTDLINFKRAFGGLLKGWSYRFL